MKVQNLGFIIETFNADKGAWKQLDNTNRFLSRKAAGVAAKQKCTTAQWRVTPLTA